MEIVFHTRHANLASDFQDIAQSKLQSIERFSVQVERIEVEITHEQNPSQGKCRGE